LSGAGVSIGRVGISAARASDPESVAGNRTRPASARMLVDYDDYPREAKFKAAPRFV
jgi:hypothetical protein